MVDVTSHMAPPRRVSKAAPASVSVDVVTDIEAARAAAAAITPNMVFTGYQHPAFLSAWVGTAGCAPMFLKFAAAGHGPVLLPLERCDNGVAGYCGGRHANGNFPVGRREDIAALSDAGETAILSAIKAAGIPANSLFLERQHAKWHNLANPFVFASSVASPNIALSFSIDGDLDTVLKTHGGKSKRKKLRSYRRKLDAKGSVEFLHPVPTEQVSRYLDRFLALKAERFRQAGIANVFGDDRIKAFLLDLFTDGAPDHTLHGLTLDGEIIAVIGCTRHANRMTVEFGSFEPEHAQLRPGELLFFSAIAHACETGIEIFDFGIGDEPYKRSWCDIETVHMDTTIGLTLAGKARAFAQTNRSRAVRAIKSNERVWSAVKTARRALARR
jgi:CelD/BcsL family acetyltransferase involved in cellulose biosynthesis